MHHLRLAARSTAAALLLSLLSTVSLWGAPPEIRFARQFSMGYLQFNVMEHDRLVEKHAKAWGLPEVKVTWAKFNGPNAMNDALLSGSIDIVSGGVPGLVTIWAKTQGTPQEIKGVSALSSQPILLNSRNPAVKGIEDFGASDRIAVPAIKVSLQAVLLEMAAAKKWGAANFAKLDQLTVSMAPPDATVALLSGAAGITAVFSVPPFQVQQLENPAIKTVLTSYDILDGPATFTVAWTSAKFRNENPVLYKALIAALGEATDIVNRDRKAAAALWIADSSAKLSPELVDRVVSGPQVKWTVVPENTMKFANFMHSVGTIKAAPGSWKDMFFPEIHHMSGS